MTMDDVTYAGDEVAQTTRNLGEQALYYAEVWGPRILAAAIILLIGWLVARAVKWGVAAVVNKTPLARHANQPNVPKRHPSTIGAQVGDAAYWVVLLIAFFLAAQPLGLASATGPIGQMLNGFGEAVPRIVGAGIIFFFGYVVAGVAKKAVEALITASHVEKLTNTVGARTPNDPTMLPRAIGGVVFALIIIPVAIAALDTLNIAAISQPATAMLNIVLNAIPRIIAAGIIIALAYAIGQFASQLLANFLASTGFDRTVNSLGLFPKSSAVSSITVDPNTGVEQTTVSPSVAATVTPSKAVGTAAFIAIVIFGMMEAFRQLNFAYGSRIMAEILTLLGSVVFGSVIIAAAVGIANFVSKAIEASSGKLAANMTRIAIIVLGAAIGLRFMGLADDIINLAFGLIIGAIALAGALAFGLGGREPAGRMVGRLLGKVEAEADAQRTPTPPTSR
jgi:Conserved TM helix